MRLHTHRRGGAPQDETPRPLADRSGGLGGDQKQGSIEGDAPERGAPVGDYPKFHDRVHLRRGRPGHVGSVGAERGRLRESLHVKLDVELMLAGGGHRHSER